MPLFLQKMAECYLKLKEYEKVFVHLKSALSLKPNLLAFK